MLSTGVPVPTEYTGSAAKPLSPHIEHTPRSEN